jgi:hypothetical protein
MASAYFLRRSLLHEAESMAVIKALIVAILFFLGSPAFFHRATQEPHGQPVSQSRVLDVLVLPCLEIATGDSRYTCDEGACKERRERSDLAFFRSGAFLEAS